MNLNQLRIFHAAAKAQSFTRAAEDLCLTQPGISKHIRQLEENVGIRLFDRLGKKVVPTHAGRLLLDATGNVFRAIEEAKARIDDLKMMRGGVITIGASFTTGTYVLPDILARFHRKHPDVEMHFDISLSRKIARSVLANRMDIGFLGAPYEDERLAICAFSRDKAIVILPKGHPWEKRRSVTPMELSVQPFILPQKGSGTRTFLMAMLKSAGMALEKRIEFGNTEAVKKAVAAGMGISVLSALAVENELASGQLSATALSDPPLERTFYYALLREKYRTHAVRALIELLPDLQD